MGVVEYYAVRCLPGTPRDERALYCIRRTHEGFAPTSTVAAALGLPMRLPASLHATPLSRFGAEITGVSLRSSLACEHVAAQVRLALDEHGLLLFRGQSDLRPEDHVALGSWFGRVFPLPPRFQHPRTPHADVLRVSNAEAEGFVGVGTAGWHIDGTSYATSFGYSLLHVAHAPQHGPTHFLPLHPLAEKLRCAWACACCTAGGCVHVQYS